MPTSSRSIPIDQLPSPDVESGARVLVVDDDEATVALVSFHLARAGYRVAGAYSASEAMQAALKERPDAAILDVSLPDGSGFHVLQAMRAGKRLRRVGVLMLSAVPDDETRIHAFELGADDCVAKPFNVRELVLRVGAIVRRLSESTPNDATGDVLRYASIELNRAGRRVLVNGNAVALSPTEFDLLNSLMAQPGRVQTRSYLLRAVWGASEADYEVGSRTIDMHLRRLRSKLGAAGRLISTVRGSGYRFDPPRPDGSTALAALGQ